MMRVMLFTLSIVFYAASVFGGEVVDKNQTSIPQNDGKMLFLSQWDTNADNPIMCNISEKKNRDGLPTRIFTCYKKSGGKDSEVFSFETLDYPVSMFQTSDMGGRLFTIWTSGSSYHFYAFAYIAEKVVKVLEKGSKTFPEFLIDSAGEDLLIISDVKWIAEGKSSGQKRATGKSVIYKWTGNSYEITNEVGWEKRLNGICQ
jgi:hypothetical protein